MNQSIWRCPYEQEKQKLKDTPAPADYHPFDFVLSEHASRKSVQA
jgi:hypothetical protein